VVAMVSGSGPRRKTSSLRPARALDPEGPGDAKEFAAGVGEAVRRARQSHGWTQAELAERAGTSQPSIARLERGQVSPTVMTLDRIARALGTDLLIDFEPQPGNSLSSGA